MAKTDPFKPIPEIIGSGPFRFLKDEFVAGSSVAYAKNTDYVPRQEPPDWTSAARWCISTGSNGRSFRMRPPHRLGAAGR